MLTTFLFLLSLATLSVAHPQLITALLGTSTATSTTTSTSSLTPTIQAAAAAATKKTKTRTTSTTTSTYLSSTTFLFQGTTLPSGLSASTWLVNTQPQAHQFYPENVYVSGGYLNLLVPGRQSSTGTISAGEVSTDFTIASASVETYAILTNVPGVCNGMFYYKSNNQETDIEWLSSAKSNANVQSPYSRAMFYTNQPVQPGTNVTQVTGPPPRNPTTTVHNYQLVWDNDKSTSFYVDGVLQRRITASNVPSATDGRWFWNNWSSGDPFWTTGPPRTDAVFRIQKIVMHYNPGTPQT